MNFQGEHQKVPKNLSASKARFESKKLCFFDQNLFDTQITFPTEIKSNERTQNDRNTRNDKNSMNCVKDENDQNTWNDRKYETHWKHETNWNFENNRNNRDVQNNGNDRKYENNGNVQNDRNNEFNANVYKIFQRDSQHYKNVKKPVFFEKSQKKLKKYKGRFPDNLIQNLFKDIEKEVVNERIIRNSRLIDKIYKPHTLHNTFRSDTPVKDPPTLHAVFPSYFNGTKNSNKSDLTDDSASYDGREASRLYLKNSQEFRLKVKTGNFSGQRRNMKEFFMKKPSTIERQFHPLGSLSDSEMVGFISRKTGFEPEQDERSFRLPFFGINKFWIKKSEFDQLTVNEENNHEMRICQTNKESIFSNNNRFTYLRNLTKKHSQENEEKVRNLLSLRNMKRECIKKNDCNVLNNEKSTRVDNNSNSLDSKRSTKIENDCNFLDSKGGTKYENINESAANLSQDCKIAYEDYSNSKDNSLERSETLKAGSDLKTEKESTDGNKDMTTAKRHKVNAIEPKIRSVLSEHPQDAEKTKIIFTKSILPNQYSYKKNNQINEENNKTLTEYSESNRPFERNEDKQSCRLKSVNIPITPGRCIQKTNSEQKETHDDSLRPSIQKANSKQKEKSGNLLKPLINNQVFLNQNEKSGKPSKPLIHRANSGEKEEHLNVLHVSNSPPEQFLHNLRNLEDMNVMLRYKQWKNTANSPKRNKDPKRAFHFGLKNIHLRFIQKWCSLESGIWYSLLRSTFIKEFTRLFFEKQESSFMVHSRISRYFLNRLILKRKYTASESSIIEIFGPNQLKKEITSINNLFNTLERQLTLPLKSTDVQFKYENFRVRTLRRNDYLIHSNTSNNCRLDSKNGKNRLSTTIFHHIPMVPSLCSGCANNRSTTQKLIPLSSKAFFIKNSWFLTIRSLCEHDNLRKKLIQKLFHSKKEFALSTESGEHYNLRKKCVQKPFHSRKAHALSLESGKNYHEFVKITTSLLISKYFGINSFLASDIQNSYALPNSRKKETKFPTHYADSIKSLNSNNCYFCQKKLITMATKSADIILKVELKNNSKARIISDDIVLKVKLKNNLKTLLLYVHDNQNLSSCFKQKKDLLTKNTPSYDKEITQTKNIFTKATQKIPRSIFDSKRFFDRLKKFCTNLYSVNRKRYDLFSFRSYFSSVGRENKYLSLKQRLQSFLPASNSFDGNSICLSQTHDNYVEKFSQEENERERGNSSQDSCLLSDTNNSLAQDHDSIFGKDQKSSETPLKLESLSNLEKENKLQALKTHLSPKKDIQMCGNSTEALPCIENESHLQNRCSELEKDIENRFHFSNKASIQKKKTVFESKKEKKSHPIGFEIQNESKDFRKMSVHNRKISIQNKDDKNLIENSIHHNEHKKYILPISNAQVPRELIKDSVLMSSSANPTAFTCDTNSIHPEIHQFNTEYSAALTIQNQKTIHSQNFDERLRKGTDLEKPDSKTHTYKKSQINIELSKEIFQTHYENNKNPSVFDTKLDLTPVKPQTEKTDLHDKQKTFFTKKYPICESEMGVEFKDLRTKNDAKPEIITSCSDLTSAPLESVVHTDEIGIPKTIESDAEMIRPNLKTVCSDLTSAPSKLVLHTDKIEIPKIIKLDAKMIMPKSDTNPNSPDMKHAEDIKNLKNEKNGKVYSKNDSFISKGFLCISDSKTKVHTQSFMKRNQIEENFKEKLSNLSAYKKKSDPKTVKPKTNSQKEILYGHESLIVNSKVGILNPKTAMETDAQKSKDKRSEYTSEQKIKVNSDYEDNAVFISQHLYDTDKAPEEISPLKVLPRIFPAEVFTSKVAPKLTVNELKTFIFNPKNNTYIRKVLHQNFKIDPENIRSGSDTRTTCMIKNIPNKYTQSLLINLLDEHHKGCYNFVYLRMDVKNRCNVGYAFINFKHHSFVFSFYKKINGKMWKKYNSSKIAVLTYASIQGLEALISRFKRESYTAESEYYGPYILHDETPITS